MESKRYRQSRKKNLNENKEHQAFTQAAAFAADLAQKDKRDTHGLGMVMPQAALP